MSLSTLDAKVIDHVGRVKSRKSKAAHFRRTGDDYPD